MGGSVKDLQSMAELDSLTKSGSPIALHFWASWCDASKQMDQVFSNLSTDFPHTHFLRVEAEEQPEISEAYTVAAVPYFVFFKVEDVSSFEKNISSGAVACFFCYLDVN